jgi:hypothetical protein
MICPASYIADWRLDHPAATTADFCTAVLKVDPATRISAEYEHWDTVGAMTDGGTLGIQHDVTPSIYLDGQVSYWETEGADINGVSVGLGFRF